MPAAAVSAAAARAVSSQSDGIEGAGLGERDREDGAEAVDDVEREEERDAEAGLLDGDPLGVAYRLAAPEVEEAADAAGADVGVDVGRDDGAGDGIVGGEDRELAELLGKGHPGDERLRPARARGDGGGAGGGEHGEDLSAGGHQRAPSRRLWGGPPHSTRGRDRDFRFRPKRASGPRVPAREAEALPRPGRSSERASAETKGGAAWTEAPKSGCGRPADALASALGGADAAGFRRRPKSGAPAFRETCGRATGRAVRTKAAAGRVIRGRS